MEYVGQPSSSTATNISDSEDECCINVPREFGRCCLKGLARLRSFVKIDTREEDDDWGGEQNFILLSAKYFVTSCHWTRHYISEYLTSKDDYWRSVVLSVSLFLIGVKLMREFVPSKVSPVEPK